MMNRQLLFENYLGIKAEIKQKALRLENKKRSEKHHEQIDCS